MSTADSTAPDRHVETAGAFDIRRFIGALTGLYGVILTLLGDLCDLIVYSHEEDLQKPDPRIFLLACERLGIQPDEMIFLDDVQEAVDAARSLGIHGFQFRDTAQAIADIEACIESQRSVP